MPVYCVQRLVLLLLQLSMVEPCPTGAGYYGTEFNNKVCILIHMGYIDVEMGLWVYGTVAVKRPLTAGL